MKALILLILVLMGGRVVGQTGSSDHLNEGIQAFRAGDYSRAVALFQKAVDASPSNVTARQYLATAFRFQWKPEMDSEENNVYFEKAISEYKAILAIQPEDKTALESLGSLYFHRGRQVREPSGKTAAWSEAERYYDQLARAYPTEKQAPYSLGVIAWSRAYPAMMEGRQRVGMRNEDPGPLRDPAVRKELRSRIGRNVDEGIRQIERALALDPEYDDAMAYLNLLYRLRAMVSETEGEAARETALADSWVQRSLEAKKAKAEKAQSAIAKMGSPNQIRVGGAVQAAKLIQSEEVPYPPLAAQARISGTVKMNVVIAKDGTVAKLTLLSGHPLLVPATAEAVRRYRYQETLLNGQPVEVSTDVEVVFALPE